MRIFVFIFYLALASLGHAQFVYVADEQYRDWVSQQVDLIQELHDLDRKMVWLLEPGRLEGALPYSRESVRDRQIDIRMTMSMIDDRLEELAPFVVNRQLIEEAKAILDIYETIDLETFRVITDSFVTTAPQFGPVRNQGFATTCSIFAGVSLLEAAYFREYGEPIDFSEMWLAREKVREFIESPLEKTGNDLTISYDLAELIRKIRETGICREATYPYQGSYSMSYFQKETSHELYLEVFGDDQAPQVKACAEEAKAFSAKVQGFTYDCLDDPTDSQSVITLLKLGIPVRGHLWGTEDHPADIIGTEGSHAINIIGHDSNAHEFIIRNSWGRWGDFFTGDRISESMFTERDGFHNIRSACFIMAPKDLKRICFHRQDLPSSLAVLCGGSLF